MAPNHWNEQAVILGLVLLDQATKAFARAWPVDGLVDPVANDRLMFGLDLGLPDGTVLAVSLAIAVGWWLVAGRAAGSRMVVARSLLVAGVVGNAFDRVVNDGAVQDWLVVGPTRWNVADLYLLVAIPMLVVAAATDHTSSADDEEQREEPVTAPLVDRLPPERRNP